MGSIGQPAIASANRRGSPQGMRTRGRRTPRGHRGHGPMRPAGRANTRRWARRGPLVDGGMKKVRGPRNSTAAEKVKVFRIGLECEGALAAQDPLTYPFKISHQDLLDGLAKKPLTEELVKLKQRGVLVNDSRVVSCSRQAEFR